TREAGPTRGTRGGPDPQQYPRVPRHRTRDLGETIQRLLASPAPQMSFGLQPDGFKRGRIAREHLARGVLGGPGPVQREEAPSPAEPRSHVPLAPSGAG